MTWNKQPKAVVGTSTGWGDGAWGDSAWGGTSGTSWTNQAKASDSWVLQSAPNDSWTKQTKAS